MTELVGKYLEDNGPIPVAIVADQQDLKEAITEKSNDMMDIEKMSCPLCDGKECNGRCKMMKGMGCGCED